MNVLLIEAILGRYVATAQKRMTAWSPTDSGNTIVEIESRSCWIASSDQPNHTQLAHFVSIPCGA
jgi:hypothetical protein